MSYAPDPGGQFASDVHRRVTAAVPNPDDDPEDVETLIEGRVFLDDYLPVEDADELTEVLRDLEADGHVRELKNGWKNTADGFALLTGPPKEGT